MAVKIRKCWYELAYHDEEGVLFEYLCDTESDVADLPNGEGITDWRNKPRAGSSALVAETGNKYKLNSEGTWDEVVVTTYKTAGPASVVSVSDAVAAPVVDLTAAIVPAQDLHGYDAPWAPGAGTNLFDIASAVSAAGAFGLSILFDATTGYVRIYGTYTREGQYASFAIATPLSVPYIDGGNMVALDKNTDATSVLTSIRWTSTGGGIAVDLNNMVLNQTYDIKFRIVIYTGSTVPASWTPYSNICPITGYNGVNVTRAGKNLLDPSTASTLGTVVWFCEPNGFLFKNGVSYTFSVSSIEDVESISIYATDKTTQLAYSSGSTRQSVTYTPTEDTYGLPRLYRSTPITQAIVDGTMIEIGSVRTTYESYQGTTYPVSWQAEAGTVYGGTLDVTTGTLTVDSVFASAVLSTAKPKTDHTQTREFVFKNFFGASVVGGSAGNNNARYKSNMEPYIYDTRDYPHFYTANNGNVSLFLPIGTDESTVFQSCVPLATPIVYHITPTEITTLLGTNVIWADTGNVTVTYKAKSNSNSNKRRIKKWL